MVRSHVLSARVRAVVGLWFFMFGSYAVATAGEIAMPGDRDENVLVVAKSVQVSIIDLASYSQTRPAQAALPTPTPQPPAPILPLNKDAQTTVPAKAVAAVKPARAVTLDIPLKADGFYLGDVSVKISPSGEVAIKPKMLPALLKKVMKESEVARIFAADAASDDFIALPILKKRGLDIAYDAQALELKVAPTVDQRPDGALSLGTAPPLPQSATAQKPAAFSAYVNMRMTLDYVSQSRVTPTGVATPFFDFDSAIRWGGVVLENEASLTPRLQISDAYDLTRRGTRLVYDDIEAVVRYKLGDIAPPFTGFQNAPNLIGVSADHVYSELRPQQNIRPTGSHSFRLERPASVDVLVDGVIVRRLRLQPGNYNINDLPLQPGANKVVLAIEEDTGARRTLEFTNFGGPDLLAPGLSEWHAAAGFQAQTASAPIASAKTPPLTYTGPHYDVSDPVVSGSYRQGLTPTATGGLYGQGDRNAVMTGANLSMQTPYGGVTVDLALSLSRATGAGLGLRATYDVLNAKAADGLSHSFRLAADYRSNSFSTIGNELTAQDRGASLAALYSKDLGDDLIASLSGTVFLEREAPFKLDRWDADITFSKRLSEEIGASLSIGYTAVMRDSADSGRATPCLCEGDAEGRGFKAMARVSYRPDAKQLATASLDMQTQTAHTTYSRSDGAGVGATSVQIDAAHNSRTRTADIDADVGYKANRADISVSHAAQIETVSAGSFRPTSASERSSARVETSLVTADGAWSVTRPVRNSFAIVENHETLGARRLTVGDKDNPAGRSDGLVPAVLSDIHPYTPKRVTYDVEDLPQGYDLGAGAFDFTAPYKSGYRVQAGSAYTVTALGTLMGQDGAPLELVEGVAHEVGRKDANDKDARKVELFTNRAGKFSAAGLSPGVWSIEMATDPAPTRYVLHIPADATGLVSAGTLKAAR